MAKNLKNLTEEELEALMDEEAVEQIRKKHNCARRRDAEEAENE